MMITLLAQLVAPTIQRGPIRLPGTDAVIERKAPKDSKTIIDKAPLESSSEKNAPEPSNRFRQEDIEAAKNLVQNVKGATALPNEEIIKTLAECLGKDKTIFTKNCASSLAAKYISKGYVNTRVYLDEAPDHKSLEVIEGRVVEISVDSNDQRLKRRVSKLLRPLQGEILNVGKIEKDLQLLKRLPEIGLVRGNLARLGSDPSQGVLKINVKRGTSPWRGEASIRNDGSSGSGEARAVGAIFKSNLLSIEDNLLIYGELSSNDTPKLGSAISSLSYTIPVSENIKLTGSLGFSRRNLIELPKPANGFSTSQYQSLFQTEWTLSETLRNKWALTAGLNYSRSNNYFNNKALPRVLPSAIRTPQDGYLKLGINTDSIGNSALWSGGIFYLQGVNQFMPEEQRREFADIDIIPNNARALGGELASGIVLSPAIQMNLRAAGQIAISPLTNSMQFALGSDAGLKGLPGQLISGDSGWLTAIEINYNVWQKNENTIQLSPFFGIGGVDTDGGGIELNDEIGSTGLLIRFIAGQHWSTEVGYAYQFWADNNEGPWEDWLLDGGLYTKIRYRF